MADLKITDIVKSNTVLADGDLLESVDISDTGDDAAGSSAKLAASVIRTYVRAGLDADDVAETAGKKFAAETGADITDTANVTAAGALMDSEVTNLALVKALATATNSAEGVLEIMTEAEYRTKAANKTVTPDIVYSAAAEITLTSTSNSVAVDLDTGINFKIDTLGENTTLANPTNTDTGQTGFIRVVQDATGSRTMAFGTSYEFAGGTAVTLTTTASAEDVLIYTVISATRILISSFLDIS